MEHRRCIVQIPQIQQNGDQSFASLISPLSLQVPTLVNPVDLLFHLQQLHSSDSSSPTVDYVQEHSSHVQNFVAILMDFFANID